MSLPELHKGMQRLGQSAPEAVDAVMSQYVPASDFASRAAKDLPEYTSNQTLAGIRDEVAVRFGEANKIGHLLSQYTLQRDKQMQMLCGLGKEVLLSFMAQGILPAQISTQLQISYDTLNEFLRITCTDEELHKAQLLAADSLVACGLDALDSALDKDDLTQAKAIMEAKFKLARTMNKKYVEEKPSTVINANSTHNTQYNDNSVTQVPYLQIVHVDRETLPELPEHRHTTDVPKRAPPEGFIDGEFNVLGS